jgi:hypothetical protein
LTSEEKKEIASLIISDVLDDNFDSVTLSNRLSGFNKYEIISIMVKVLESLKSRL